MLGHQRIVAAIDHYLEALVDEKFRGSQCFDHVGIESLLVTQDFQLDQSPPAGLACQPQGANRILASETAGGVRQVCVFLRIDEIGEAFLAGIGQVYSAHRDGHNLGPAGLQRGGVLSVALVLAGSDDEARAERPAGDHQRLVHRRVAASDELDDLEPVSFSKRRLRVLRARHNLQVSLHGDLGGVQPHACQKHRHADGAAEVAGFSIDRYCHSHKACSRMMFA